MKPTDTTFLPLDGYKLIDSKIMGGCLHITLECLAAPPSQCDSSAAPHVSDYRRWSNSVREVRDLPVNGMPVLLNIKRTRYRCHKCSQTAMQEMPGIHQREHTQRLIDAAVHGGLVETYQQTADRLHLPLRTVSWMCIERIAQWDALYLPLRLDKLQVAAFSQLDYVGITTGKGRGRHTVLVANAETSTLVDIVNVRQDDLDSVISQYVQSHFVGHRVLHEAAMPPWEVLRSTLRTHQPHCRMVIDPFALMALTHTCALRARALSRKTVAPSSLRYLKADTELLATSRYALTNEQDAQLAIWADKVPMHHAAYVVKEVAHDIYADAHAAAERLQTLIEILRHEMVPGFEQLLQVLQDWHKEILAFFDSKLAGSHALAAIDALRSKLPQLGLTNSYHSARARMLYGTGKMPNSAKEFGPSIQRLPEELHTDRPT